jgi:Spy/CpxP family protein refolding chaperone
MPSTKARSEAAILVAVVFLLGVLLGGLGNHLWGERMWGVRADVPSPQQKHLDVLLTEQLQLTPDQQKQFHAIVQDTQAKWRALYAPLAGQQEQIRAESHDQMRAVLTPEQRPQFDVFIKTLAEQRKQNEASKPIPGPARPQ